MYRCTKYDGTIEIRTLKQIQSYIDSTNCMESLYIYFISRYKDVQPFPCGYCPECLKKKSADWATRCFLESKEFKHSCFLTLTYDDDKLDVYGSKDYEPLRGISLIKKDLQKFLKRLRYRLDSQLNIKVKFFACGEYGDKNGRPHFHILLYNYDFPDKYVSSVMKSRKGFGIYESPFLNDLWKYGLASIQEVTSESCNYVSKYILKKKYGMSNDYKYNALYNGNTIRLEKEYNTMSKREPIGKRYFLKYYKDLFERGRIAVGKGCLRGLPKVFMDWLKKIDFDLWISESIKRIKNLKLEFDIGVLKIREVAYQRKIDCIRGVF